MFKFGNINYLGRDGIKSNEFEGDDFANKLRKCGLYNTIMPSSNNFSPALLNVISDENFFILNSINKIQYNSKSDWKHTFNLVSNLLEDFEVELLVTLLKKSGLIFPLFVQKYKFLYGEEPNITYQDFIYFEDSVNLKSDFELFNFEELYNFFSNYKLKVNYLFFENLEYDKTSFSSCLANVIGVKQRPCTRVFRYFL